ncbi:unnamed protein product [Musa textilis]
MISHNFKRTSGWVCKERLTLHLMLMPPDHLFFCSFFLLELF